MMLRASRFVLPFVLFFLAAVPALAEGRRVAMVVGNSAYAEASALPNTINDAEAIARSLERLGFEVFAIYDAKQADLLETMADFTKALKGAESAVFYYAGHGIQVGNENYILPVDISVENELSIRYGALSLTDVLRDLERLSSVAIVILDACRDNPFAAQLQASDPTRSLGPTRGLAPVSPSGNGALIAYAAAAGELASDGDSGHSPFTAALLEEMEKPGVEIGLLFRRVAGKVIDATGGTQRPELLIRLAREYYLAEVPQPVLAAALEPPVATPVIVETAPVDPVVPPAPLPVALPADVEAITDRQAVAPALDDAADRAALWGYVAALSQSPFDLPAPLWEAPAGQDVAEAEPNNSFGAAQPLGANDTVKMSIGAAGDADWYRLNVGQGGRLSVKAAAPPAEITLAVRLLNANGDELVYWIPAPRPGGELSAEFDLPRGGLYWLQFADNAGAASTAAFQVELSYAVQPDAYEPNGRIDLARHIPLESSFPIALLPRGDREWFKLTTEKPGALLVSLTDVPETVEGAFRLLNADGTEIVYWVPAPRPGGDTVAVLDLPRPGVYFLELAENRDDAASPLPLTLSTRFAPSPDRYEPNDSMAQAMPVPVEGLHEIAIFPRGDQDWLELDIAQPGELTIAVAAPPPNLDLAFRILDAGGAEAQYWTFSPRPGGDLTGSFDVARPGRYFVQLTDNSNDAGSIDPIALEIGFTASLDAFEPNNSIGTAAVLTAGGEVPFTILPRGDADWFRVSVAEPGELSVTIDESPANLDLTYRVLNTDWTELAYWVPAYRKGGLTEGLVDLPRPGTYFIEVRDGSNDERSIEPATLKTQFTPTPNAQEPNNVFGEATPVEIDGETTAHILPIGDADWHIFQAPGPGELDVSIEDVPENLDVAFRLLNADRTEIQYWIGAPRPGGLTAGTLTIPAAGWYWMEIRDGNSDQRSPKPFRVVRTFRPVGG